MPVNSIRLATLIFFLVILHGTEQLIAQTQKKNKLYDAVVIWTDQTNHAGYDGHMIELRDSSILFVDLHPRNIPIDDRLRIDLRVNEIAVVKFRRKGAVGRGAAIGAASGLALGAFIGVMAYKAPQCSAGTAFCGIGDPGRGGAALAGGIIGLAGGAAVGAGAGAIRAKYELNGNIDRYRQNKEAMSKYLYRSN